MKRRIKLSTLIKRTLLTVLGVVVLSVLLVFIFDKYKPTENTFNNKYSDDYWNQEVLEGFEYSADIYKRINKYDIENTKEYVSPWVADGLKEEQLTLEQRTTYGRYKLEHNIITKPITDVYNVLEPEIKGLNVAKEWADQAEGKTAQDYASYKLNLSEGDYSYLYETFKGKTFFDYVDGFGTTATYKDLVNIVATGTSISNIENAIKALIPNEKNKTAFGKDFDEYVLACFIVLDTQLYEDVCSFDYETYYEKLENYNYYADLYEKANNHAEGLLEWKQYYQQTLLGFGGLATDNPNKPVFTVKTEDHCVLEFWFNTYLTTFKLVKKDKLGNVIQSWDSNPNEADIENPDNKYSYEIKSKQRTILNLSYSVLNGQTDVYSNFDFSVSQTNIYNDKLDPNYAVNIDVENNKLIVWYKLEKRGIDYTYFPKFISAEKMKEYLARNKKLVEEGATFASGKPITYIEDTVDSYGINAFTNLTSIYKFIPAFNTIGGKQVANPNNEFGYDYYEYTGVKSMSDNVRNFLYPWFYEAFAYTEQDLQSDNSEFGYEVNLSKPKYEVAIEYTLTSNGLEVTIPGNSIKEDPKYPLTYIDILPYFTATKEGVEGYTVIPDGSGAILEHNNGKNYPQYQKRVYTTDLTNTTYVNKGSLNDLMFPMYAVVNPTEESGILTYAKSSAAQLQLTADVAGRATSPYGKCNVNFFTAYLRESKIITVGQFSYEKKQLTKWTNAMVQDDITLKYQVLEEDKLNYSAVAKEYRDILVEMYGLEVNDKTTNPVLDMDVIGQYSYKENFIGIPYTAKDSLTTIDQLFEMITAFQEKGVKNINAFYLGWRNTGLKNTSFETIKFASKLGSKAKFKALFEKQDENVNIYPYVSFGEVNKYQESFGKNHYTTHAVDGDVVWKQPYDLNSNVYDKTKSKIYILSPRYYISFAETLAENYKKATNGYNSLAIDKIGSELSGDYRKGAETFKGDAVKNQIASLEAINASGVTNLTLYKPYDYAFKYVDNAKNIPYLTTQYEILDYSVPFYQLVVNGLFDYSGESFNANSEKGLMEHLMRMIETGSNLSFTFSGDSSEELLQTDYNYYYYTLYTDWIEDVLKVYNTLEELGIYNGELIAHEYIASNIYKVTYKTANGNIQIYLNYTRTDYTAPDGTVVPDKGYTVIK